MSQQVIQFSRLPDDLKALNQWCIAGPDKAPLIAGQDGKLYNASPIQGPWHSFADACALAQQHNALIGFVLTEDDPFACIDLDVKDAQSVNADGSAVKPEKWTTPTWLQHYEQTVHTFASYTEASSSGKGIHIWVRGAVEKGLRKDGVELYSKERFIVCTGQHFTACRYNVSEERVVSMQINGEWAPIADRQNMLDGIAAYIKKERVDETTTLIELDPDKSDSEVLRMAMAADNADKFNMLCAGQYRELGFPSQSEADLALMSMFTFYSKSNEQCRRLFRRSALGQREKANKDNVYLDRTLSIIRARQEREAAEVASQEALAKDLVRDLNTAHVKQETQAAVESTAATLPEVEGLEWPPGLAGALAAFFYNSAPRPVKEVAIVAALGFLAGVCGKAYNIPQSGLNLYIILIARSAVGKEAMHSGIGLLLEKMRKSIPGVDRFVDFSDFASGPALTKACSENSSFVNIAGEWGRKLSRLALEEGREGPMQQLRTVMTNLYQKSGATSVVGGINYSTKEKNVASVNGVAYSMIGETTPRTFFNSLTDTMMEDGFLSRFNIIEYTGKRPGRNLHPQTEMDPRLYECLCALVVQALTTLNANRTNHVLPGEGSEMLDAFDLECDEQINDTDDESQRQMWNRAHLKALRMAGLLAAADNHIQPVIQKQHAEWAIAVVRRDIALMSSKLQSGDVGAGDGTRERKLLSLVRDYIGGNVAKGYKIPPEMITDGIVPRKFLQMRCSAIQTFTQHRLGSTAAMDNTIRSVIESGWLAEVPKETVAKYNFHGKCYRLISLPDYTKI